MNLVIYFNNGVKLMIDAVVSYSYDVEYDEDGNKEISFELEQAENATKILNVTSLNLHEIIAIVEEN